MGHEPAAKVQRGRDQEPIRRVAMRQPDQAVSRCSRVPRERNTLDTGPVQKGIDPLRG